MTGICHTFSNLSEFLERVRYDTASEYQMQDLSVESFAALVERMALNGSSEWQSYRSHYLKGYDGPTNSAPCEGDCKAKNLLLLNGTYHDLGLKTGP